MASNAILPKARVLPGDTWLLNWGRVALGASFGFGLIVTVYLASLAPGLLPFLPAVMLGGIAAWVLFQYPLWNLFVMLVGYVLVAGFSDEKSIVDVLYFAWFVVFMGHWFITRIVLGPEHLFGSSGDVAIGFFLAWVTLSFGTTLLMDGDMTTALSEWSAVMFLSFYFPVSRAVRRYDKGAQFIVGALILLGVLIAVRNLYDFSRMLSDATMLWQVARGRVVDNEILLLLPALASLTLLVQPKSRIQTIILAGIFILTFSSLILTQSRAYWLDFVVGVVVLFILLQGKPRLRLIQLTIMGFALFGGLAVIILGDTFFVLLFGLVERVMSIFSAGQSDISFINRLYESDRAWQHILSSPIIGHGPGTSYAVFDIIKDVTMFKPFVHNGFLLLWFKYGLIGLVAVTYFWFRGIRTGYYLIRKQSNSTPDIRHAVFGVVSLIALFPSALTSLPFYLSDSLLSYAILLGLIEGIRTRTIT